jgi:hypothetical protein
MSLLVGSATLTGVPCDRVAVSRTQTGTSAFARISLE